MIVLIQLFFLILFVLHAHAATVQWVADAVSTRTSTSFNTAFKQSKLNIFVRSNGLIHKELIGHFKIDLQYINSQGLKYTGSTDCIDLTSPAVSISDGLKRLQLYQLYSNGTNDFTDPQSGASYVLDSLYTTNVKRYFNHPASSTTYNTTFELTLGRRKNVSDVLIADINYAGCSNPRTIADWSDTSRWTGGVLPTSVDDVVITSTAGVVRLASNITVRSLTMRGGWILGHSTYCPYGWSAEPEGPRGIKCYKMFEEPKPFDAAEHVCNADVGFSSENRHLIHIRNRAELMTAMRMCRGQRGSAVHSRGCWIGLQDRGGTGDFDWISPIGLGVVAGDNGKFLDWRRDEPNNHSISDGFPSGGGDRNGERCAALVPWQEDPLNLEQGSWKDDSCTSEKPFLCQVYGNTERFTITASSGALLTGGGMEGGVLQLATVTGTVGLYSFNVTRSGHIRVSSTATDCVLGNVLLMDGSSLTLHANARTQSDAFIGEPLNTSLVVTGSAAPSYLLMQPSLTIAASATVTFAPLCTVLSPTDCSTLETNVTINARAFVMGNLSVTGASDVILLQGADMAKATVSVATGDSHMRFAGYSSRLNTYDAYRLQVKHRGEVIGEFYRNLALEQANQHLSQRQGVFRLKVASVAGASQISQCIAYNATAAELKTILDALPLVAGRGGTTVRRYGSARAADFRYGYTWRIEMDAVETSAHALGPLALSVHCYGLDGSCGCAETKVVLVDATGIPQCPAMYTQRTSLVDPDSCVIAPEISVSVLTELAHTRTTGLGSIEVREGVHRFPPLSSCTLAVTAGTGVVASDRIAWNSISVTGTGRLIMAGTGWSAWDSSYALYEPEWFTARGRVSDLTSAPAFNMTVQSFYMSGMGSVLSSCVNSTMSWATGIWAGGIIGGRSTLYVTDQIDCSGSGKSLRYGLTMIVNPTAQMTWTAGNISLGDGADIIVEGSLSIDTASTGVGVFMGMAQLLEVPEADPDGLLLLHQEAGRSWYSYYGDELPAELRGGWYDNPLCGEQCLATNHLIIRGDGTVSLTSFSEVTYSLPLDLIGQSRLSIGSNVAVTIASGGICGNDVVIDISSNTTLELSGGRMLMQATCTIQGEGELLVTAGSHDLSFSIDAHITIQGGSMVWPLSRGTQKTITFNGGLLMQNTGELQVNPFSTTILVKKEVYLKDQSLIQFPLIGIAAQASLFDEQDAPDLSPRGNLTATGIMRWEGGTLRGKADFNALVELYLDGGTKYIKSLAKLVNKGHCEWGTGDLISSDSGDFLNLGTVQMKEGVNSFSSNALYQGTELPIENGGDVFALNYHSWDMDNGGLDYRPYVLERTKFVSRAPRGWTVESQG